MAHRVGQQLGNYRLHRLLGRGGFAEVYLGYHQYLHTPAAIKLLRQPLSQPAQQAFLLEAQTIARLLHPHIVRVLDFGVAEETSFLVLDYAPYGSLRQRYGSGRRVPLEEVVVVVEQISQALQYAHLAGRIHQDIKPENLLLGWRKQVWLSDFGLAIPIPPSSQPTILPGAGTVAYAAPEQLLGQPVPASDQYALGVVVYEWLSGQTPFVGPSLDLAIQHLLAPPLPLRQRLPTLPSAVEEVVLTALAKDPNQRFPSVAAFADALSQASQRASASYWLPARRATPALPPASSAGPAYPHGGTSPQAFSSLSPATHAISGRQMSREGPDAPAQSLGPSPQPSLRVARQRPLLPNRVGEEDQQEGRFRQPSLPVAPGVLPPRWTARERLAMGLLLLSVLCVGLFSVSLGWNRPGAGPTPGFSAQANGATISPALTPTLMPRSSVPASPTVTPTASPTPEAHLLRVGLTPSSFVDHCGTHKGTLPPSTLLLDNTGSTVSVTWQIQITDKDRSGHPWATASPASGAVPAGQQETFLLVPTSKLCQHTKGEVTYQALFTYQGAGITGTIRITDLVIHP